MGRKRWEGVLRSICGRRHVPHRVGSYIVSFGVEQQGGPAHDEVKKWLAERGETREPTKQEIVDWSIVHYGSSAPPIAKPDGTKVNPVPVKDARYCHGYVMEVAGKWYMNDLSAGSKATQGFPAADVRKGDTRPEPAEPDYKEVVAKVRARVQAVDVPPGGGKFAIQLRRLVKDLSSIVGNG